VNKYTRRALDTAFWIGFFIMLGLVDYGISLWHNEYTLSKLILWANSKSAVTLLGVTFMLGYLVGHLQAAQDPLPPASP
jgi:hypothetical protein